jgi:CRP-like cAMP-binding protein
MYNSPRAATIKAAANCILWTLDRVFFRQAMVTSSSNQNIQLCQFLSKINLFENLGTQSLNQLARSLTKQSYEDGHYIIRQGEIGEKFYVIFKGTVVCTRTGDNGTETFLVELHAGDVFGERALIKKEPRAANVITRGPVECYYLDRNNFNLMLGGLVDRMNQMNELRILKSASIFQGLTDKRLKILRKLLNKYTLMKNQLLLCEGSNSIYIILEGTLENQKGQIYSVGDCTGILDRNSDTIICDGDLTTKSEEAVVMSIHKQTLLEHIQSQERDSTFGFSGLGDEEATREASRRGSIDLTNMDIKRDSILMKNISSHSYLKPPRNKQFLVSKPTDFILHSSLGKGTFGNVYIAVHQQSRQQIAFKCLHKESLVKSGQYLYIKREAIALQHFSSPFIVEYYGLLMTPLRVIFLLEYISGVELWTYLYNYKGTLRGPYGGLDMISVSTIAGSILLALEHIHSYGYAYRDLKPENIIIGHDSRHYIPLTFSRSRWLY